MYTAIEAKDITEPIFLDKVKLNAMHQITVNVPEEKMADFMDMLVVLGLFDNEIFPETEIRDWQKKMIDERLEEIRLGKATFTDWKDFEKELDNDGIK